MPAVIFCPAGLEAGEDARDHGLRRHASTRVRGSYDDCSRLVSELAGEVEWGIVNVNLRSYYAEGSKTLAFEIIEQLGWETPDAVVLPIASGAMFTKVWQGFEQFGRLGLIDERPAAALRRPGRGLRARRVGVRRGAARVAGAARTRSSRSIAIGNPADGDLAIATARDVRRRDPLGARGRDRPEHRAAGRDRRRVRRGSDRGVTVGALREPRSRAARSASPTAWSCSSPAPG